jgi:hypothetical protein
MISSFIAAHMPDSTQSYCRRTYRSKAGPVQIFTARSAGNAIGVEGQLPQPDQRWPRNFASSEAAISCLTLRLSTKILARLDLVSDGAHGDRDVVGVQRHMALLNADRGKRFHGTEVLRQTDRDDNLRQITGRTTPPKF